MPFSNKTKKLTPVQTTRFTEVADRIFGNKLHKGKTGHFTKRFGKQEAPTQGGRPKHARTEGNNLQLQF